MNLFDRYMVQMLFIWEKLIIIMLRLLLNRGDYEWYMKQKKEYPNLSVQSI